MATGRYNAVIDLGVVGTRRVDEILNKTESLRDILKSINKTPIAIDDKRASNVFRQLAKTVNDFTRDITNGNKQLANTEIGLQKQANALSRVAGQSKIGGAVYTNAIEAQVKAEQKLRLAQIERINVEQKLFARGKTAFNESFKGIPELLKLEAKISNTTASLGAYRDELVRTLDVVEIGSNEFRALEEAIAQVDKRLSSARLSGQTSSITPALGPATQLGSISAFKQREKFEQQLEQQLIRQLAVEQRINQANLDENQKQRLRNDLGEATNQLAAKELTIAKQLTTEVDRQRISLERARDARIAGGTLRTGQFTPLTSPKRAKGIRQSAVLLQEKLNTLQARGVNVAEARSRLEKIILDTEQDKLDLSLKSLNNLDDELNSVRQLLRLERQRLSTKNAQAKADKTGGGRSRLKSAFVGAAFPALFGGGPASILGGFVGELFGPLGGVVGSALAAPIDEFVKSTAQLGQALNPLTADFGKISESLGIAGTETQQYIDALVEAGREQEAAAFATSELAALIGNEGVNALKEFGADTQDLANEFTRAMTIMSAAITEIINRTGILKAIADQVGQANLFRQARESTDAAQQERFAEFDRLGYGGIEGGSGLDAAKRRAELEREIIENQRVLNTLKKEGLDIDGVAGLKTEQQGRTIQNNLDKSINALEISRINAGLENEKVFELRLQGIELKRNEAINANILALNNKQITRLQAIKNQTRINADAEAAINNLTNDRQKALDKLNQTGGGGTGADGDKIIQDLVRQTALQKELNILATEKPEDRIAKIKLEKEEQLLRLQNSRLSTLDRIAEIADAELRAIAQSVELELTASRVKAINLEADTKIADEKDRQKNALEKSLRSIQNEIDLSKARLDGNEDQVALEQQLQAIKESTGIKDAEALENLKQTLVLLQEQLASEKAIQEVRDIQRRTATAGAGLRAGFIGQAGQAFEQQLQQGATAERATEIALLTKEMELAELQAQSMQNAVLGIGDAFATAMTTGVSELIAGTKSAEEVFSDFLKGVGSALLQSAQQMIATYIAIGIARAFAGLAGGGAPDAGDAMGGSGSLPLIANPGESVSMNAAGSLVFPGLAKGGPVKADQPYIVGEEGPELFIPGTSGLISNNDQFEAARAALIDDPDFTAEEESVVEKLGTSQGPGQLNQILRDSRSAVQSITRLSKEREIAGVNQLTKEIGAAAVANTGSTLFGTGSSTTTNNLKEVLGGDSSTEKVISAIQQAAQAEAVTAARDALIQAGDEQGAELLASGQAAVSNNNSSSVTNTSREYIEKLVNASGTGGANTVNNINNSSTFGGASSSVSNSSTFGGASSSVSNSSTLGDSRTAVDRVTALSQTRQMLESVSSVNKERDVERVMESTANGNVKPLDVRYESQVINNVEYVTAEQHRRGLAEAAERGRAMTLQTLQTSVKSRRKVGLA